jgi:hypothetical protein
MVQVGNQKNNTSQFSSFFFSYFVNSQIWLDQLMDNCHLGYIAKLAPKKKEKRKKSTTSHISGVSIQLFSHWFLL